MLFSATGVYLGAVLFDERPDLIWKTLGRRDDLNQADWFSTTVSEPVTIVVPAISTR